jgi:predicted metal-dependent hydrolase
MQIILQLEYPLIKIKQKFQKLVLDKASWILRKQKEYRETKPEIIKPSFKENATLPYLGNNYSLMINKKQARNSIEVADGKFIVRIKLAKISNNTLKKLYENWITAKAQDIFQDKVRKYSKKLRVRAKGVAIKNLRNRWGSLAKSGAINLNLNLVKAPEDIIDYIVLHELCHLRIKEHSHHYWELVHRFMPNYQDKIEWLNANGDNLM